MKDNEYAKALGEMKVKFVDEYASYEPKGGVKVYVVVKILAACLAVVLCAGTVWFWVKNDRTPQGNRAIVAENETDKPDEENNAAPKETPLPMASFVPEESIEPTQGIVTETPKEDDTVKNDNNEMPTESGQTKGSNQELDATEVPNQEQDTTEVPQQEQYVTDVPELQKQPVEPEVDEQQREPQQEQQQEPQQNTIITAFNWNNVDTRISPGQSKTNELDDWRTEVDSYVEENQEVMITTPPVSNETAMDGIKDAYGAGNLYVMKDGISWVADRLELAPVSEGWYWFDTSNLVWEKEYVLQTPKSYADAFSDVLLTRGEKKLYILQNKTDAKTLEEANGEYPEEVFKGNLKVSYQDGMPVYLVMNANEEIYVRFLMDDTLVTIVDKGYGKWYIKMMLQAVKKTF